MPALLHKQVALDATPTTDQGEFTALAATWSVDTVNEQIVKGAFRKTLRACATSGKRIPIHWNHETDAMNVIGSVDPATARETDEGLYVKGRLDLEDSAVAKEAWRSMKDNRVALSFGYLVTGDRKRRDGVRELTELDLFEVTLTPSPANPDTRVLSMKGTNNWRKRELGQRREIDELAVKAHSPVQIETFEC